jgi:hypothetical protein
MPALLPLILSLAPELARLLAGDRAGTITSRATDLVRTVTGTDDPDAAAVVLQDPAKAAELRIRLAEIAAEAETARLQAVLADAAGARAQTVQLAQAGSSIAWAAPVVSLIVVAGFFACVWLLMLSPRAWDERTAALLNVLFGALTIGFGQVTNYWLGSSAGSKASGDAVRAIATSQPGPAANQATVATTAPVTVNPPPPSPPGTTADDLNAGELARAQGAR